MSKLKPTVARKNSQRQEGICFWVTSNVIKPCRKVWWKKVEICSSTVSVRYKLEDFFLFWVWFLWRFLSHIFLEKFFLIIVTSGLFIRGKFIIHVLNFLFSGNVQCTIQIKLNWCVLDACLVLGYKSAVTRFLGDEKQVFSLFWFSLFSTLMFIIFLIVRQLQSLRNKLWEIYYPSNSHHLLFLSS